MARPSKLTPKMAEAILKVLLNGNTRSAAAVSVGIPRETLSRWAARSFTFRQQILAAEARAEVRCVTTIMSAIEDGSTANAQWWLERRRHQEWGRIERVEVTIQKAAEKIAAELGLEDASELIREAERIAAGVS